MGTLKLSKVAYSLYWPDPLSKMADQKKMSQNEAYISAITHIGSFLAA